MSCHPAISSLVVYGAEAEEELCDVMSSVVGESVRKIHKTFDTMDVRGNTVFGELKRRSRDYHYNDEKIKKEGWLIPSCKIIRGWLEMAEGFEVYLFYFWSSDKTLWYYKMKEGDFCSGDCHKPPKNHYDKQLHVWIPEECWTRVPIDLSGLMFEEDECWIE